MVCDGHVCEMENRSSAMRMSNAPVYECQVTFFSQLYINSPCLCPCFCNFRVLLSVSGSSWFSSYCGKIKEDGMGEACGAHGGRTEMCTGKRLVGKPEGRRSLQR